MGPVHDVRDRENATKYVRLIFDPRRHEVHKEIEEIKPPEAK